MLKQAATRSMTYVADFHRGLGDSARLPRLAFREIVVLLTTAVLLVVYFYYGKTRSPLEQDVREYLLTGPLAGLEPEWHNLLGYGYAATASFIIRVVIPLIVIIVLLRGHPRDFGFGIKGAFRHIWIYVLLMLAMVPLLYGASLDPSFQAKYPYYKQASEGGWHFVIYEGCRFVQFMSLEIFFRGFILFGLYKRFGWYALIFMAMPYCLIHFGKPLPETLGAIFAGVILGYLALKYRSVFLGGVLHWGVGFAMDLFAMMQTVRK